MDNTYEIRNGQPLKYVFGGNLRLAKVSGNTVRYYHKDHLGSSALVTDASGNLVDSMVFEAFGQQQETCQIVSGNVAYTYTDQEWDGETGLYNYDARLYDAVLGQFLSADSVIADFYHPQGLDRYAYALNNPLKFVDPDGHEVIDFQESWRFTGGTMQGYEAANVDQQVLPYGITVVSIAAGGYPVLELAVARTLFTKAGLTGLKNFARNMLSKKAARGVVEGASKKGPGSVDDLVGMMNKRLGVKAEYATGDALEYMEKIGAEGSHLLKEGGGSHILLRKDVATRRTALHEWLHRSLQRKTGGPRPGEDKIIEQFLDKHKNLLKID